MRSRIATFEEAWNVAIRFASINDNVLYVGVEGINSPKMGVAYAAEEGLDEGRIGHISIYQDSIARFIKTGEPQAFIPEAPYTYDTY